MRDETIYRMFSQVQEQIQAVTNMLKIVMSGEAIQNEAFKNILIKKGLMTEEEYTKTIGEIIQQINDKHASEEKKSELIQPSVEDITTIDATKTSPNTAE